MKTIYYFLLGILCCFGELHASDLFAPADGKEDNTADEGSEDDAAAAAEHEGEETKDEEAKEDDE